MMKYEPRGGEAMVEVRFLARSRNSNGCGRAICGSSMV